MASLHEEYFASDAVLSPLSINLNSYLVRNTGHKKPHPSGGWGGGWGEGGRDADSAGIGNSPTSRRKNQIRALCHLPPALPPALHGLRHQLRNQPLICALRGWSQGERTHGKDYKLWWQDFPNDSGSISVTKLMSHSYQKSWILIPNWASTSWVTMNKSFNLTVCFLSYKIG